MTAPDERAFWTMPEVAERYRIPLRTARHWRVIGFGPRGARVGNRVLYPMSEILRFDAQILDEVDQSAPQPPAVTSRPERSTEPGRPPTR